MKCKHNNQPDGYLQWHEWAMKKSKTQEQTKCPDCGLYEIWIKKDK